MFFCSLFCLYSSWVFFFSAFYLCLSCWHLSGIFQVASDAVHVRTSHWDMSGSSVLVSLTEEHCRQPGFFIRETSVWPRCQDLSQFSLQYSISPKKNLWSPVCVGSDRRPMFWKWIRKQGPGAGLLCLIIQSAGFPLMPLVSTWCISFPLHSN